jgi:hypothetical protein
MKNKKDEKEIVPHINLMICTPGHSMMAPYVKSLMAWATKAGEEGISWGLSTGYSSHVADAREIVTSGTMFNSLVESRPFNGSVTYDKLMWIDSDIEFTPEDIFKLYKSDKDIITGGYLISNGDVMVYEKLGKRAYRMEDVEKMEDIIEIEAAGFGFICVKQGVFESLTRPWFQSANTTVKLEDGSDYTFAMIGEDISWCQRVLNNGYKLWFDPSVKVNHHKMVKLTWNGIQPA